MGGKYQASNLDRHNQRVMAFKIWATMCLFLGLLEQIKPKKLWT